MTSHELTTAIYNRLKKARLIIFLCAIIASASMIFYALRKPVTYTSTASVFPLSSGNDNNATSSTLSALLGSETPKSFSEDASINIIELAQSRTAREEVAAIRDTASGNETIAELLFDDINGRLGLFEQKVKLGPGQNALITWAGEQLKEGLNASINKNNMLILTYTGRSPELVRTISYGFINKISLFYIQLKQEKAKRDFEFATGKVDSLRNVMNSKDNQLIAIDKRTLFTNTGKLEFKVPTENLIADKQMIRQQYAQAVANQQNAAYKLQKATPLIKVLDKPEPPYDIKNKSAMIYGLIGLLAGAIVVSLFFAAGIIITFTKHEFNKAVFGTNVARNTRDADKATTAL